MANDINQVVLVGRLTREAELKYTGGGTAICKFSIAVNRSRKSGEGWTDEAHFFDIVLWGRQGEAISKYLSKGKQVAVAGELRQNRWTTDDGQNRSKVEVHANNVQLLGGAKSDGAGGGQQSGGYNRKSAADAVWDEPAPNAGGDQMDFEDDIPF
jgi:single-strand DNA-binding protein